MIKNIQKVEDILSIKFSNDKCYSVVVFDDCIGNPNGDPNAEGMPRMIYNDELNEYVCIRTNTSVKRQIIESGLETAYKFADDFSADYLANNFKGFFCSDNEDSNRKEIMDAVWKELNKPTKASVREKVISTFFDRRWFGATGLGDEKKSDGNGHINGLIQIRDFKTIYEPETYVDGISCSVVAKKENDKDTGKLGTRTGIYYGRFKGVGCYKPSRRYSLLPEDLKMFFLSFYRMDTEENINRVRRVMKKFYIIEMDKKADAEIANGKFIDEYFSWNLKEGKNKATTSDDFENEPIVDKSLFDYEYLTNIYEIKVM